MASDPRESQGPDRCRGSTRCLEFHDPDVGDLGGHYNCCCCEPCGNVRPFMAAWKPGDEHEWAVCCNCAPRIIYARFVPDDPDADCCRTAGVPMFHTADNEHIDLLHSVYVGALFSIGIRIELGNVDDGYGPQCGWKIDLERSEHSFLPDVDHSSIVPIDHDDSTCLVVPDISVAVVGPDGCTGTLVLENIPTAKLPYIERQDVVDFESHRPPEDDPECLDAYGEIIDAPACDPEFFELDPPCGQPAVLVDDVRWLENLPQFQWDDSESLRSVYWSTEFDRWVIGEENETPAAYGPVDYADGEPYGIYFDDPDCASEEECPYTTEVTRDPNGQCVQVCSRLQQRSTIRSAASSFNCMEWRWFDDSYDDPYSGEPVLLRGWRHTDPRNDETETLWLEEDDERRCQVRSVSGEHTATQLLDVDSGCSCALVVVIHVGGASTIFRCGFCTRWDYYCGTCRCIPAELCVMFFDGETFYPNIILTWDEDERRWGGEYDQLQIEISNDESLGCVIVPVLSFDLTSPFSPVVHVCSDEFTWEGKRIQSASNVLNATFEGTREVYGGEELPVYVTVNSLVPHCDAGPCGDLPCDERCNSNPATVTATIEVYYYEELYYELYGGGQGDMYIGNDGYCSWSVELYYSRSVIAIGGTGLEIGCHYEGWYTPGGEDCSVYHVSYSQGRVVITFIGQDAQTDDQMVVEECEPFYASTNEKGPMIGEAPNWPQFPIGSEADIRRCLGCPDWATVLYRVVITE